MRLILKNFSIMNNDSCNSFDFTDNSSSIVECNQNQQSEFILRLPSVKLCLIISYTIVFIFCSVGNLLVMIVLVKHRRMRTATNFFLGNLAFADFCVGIFCVYQNLSNYLMNDWALGDFMCKMYHFINGLSYTTSVVILVLICIERFLAITHPLISKQILTFRRLKLTMIGVWFGSAGYCSPRLIMYGTETIPGVDGKDILICILKRRLYNSKIYDLVQFIVLFVVPLLLMSVLYMNISLILWNSSLPQVNVKDPTSKKKGNTTKKVSEIEFNEFSKIECPGSVHEIEISHSDIETQQKCTIDQHKTDNRFKRASVGKCNERFIDDSKILKVDSNVVHSGQNDSEKITQISFAKTKTFCNYAPSARRILKARRKVIKLLLIVVLSFALCNLPFHARKLWTHWSPSSNPGSDTETLLTPITSVIMYFNSGINPILYAFFSKNFRKCMADVLSTFVFCVKKKILRCSNAQ